MRTGRPRIADPSIPRSGAGLASSPSRARAQDAARVSAGVLPGNGIRASASLPVGVCGPSGDAAGPLNPAFADSCATTTTHVLPGRGVVRPAEEPAGPGTVDGRTSPPPYGGEESAPRPYGGGEGASPGTGRSTPPGGGEAEFPGKPPTLPHTGGAGPAMIAASAVSAALIAAGLILYRRGRSASRR
ncbi:chaplin family protein [Streptomyces sp. NPDC046870]|uniref:chaplin family protein n=1 Tax=Streptomyces sp. NPDC046870 TaxID=3155135 RepID=UPI00345154E9